MSYSYIAQPRLNRYQQALRRANAKVDNNALKLKNLLKNTVTLPLGWPASKVLESLYRSR